ncbi:hypothetical protein AAIP21_27495 [Pseudomonas aeruginosa]
MRPATPAVMGRNLAVPCGNRRRSQGNDSNEQHPRVVEAQQANAGETPISSMPFPEGITKAFSPKALVIRRENHVKTTCVRSRHQGHPNPSWMPLLRALEGVLRRCYSKSGEIPASYDGCRIADEWLTFSNFKRWMESRPWKEITSIRTF